MKKHTNTFIALLILIISFLYFYNIKNQFLEVSKIYVSILIFFFASIIGVFMAKQGRRYNLIVKDLTDFNGNLSYLYRGMEIVEKKYQDELAFFIKDYYSELNNKDYRWDWFIKRKSTLLTDINRLYIKIINDRSDELNKLESSFIGNSQGALLNMHKIRKNLVPLINENIPLLQWTMIGLLTSGLVISIVSFDSQFSIIQSVLKALYISSIYSVIATLYRMNKLTFYKEMPGESSAKDVLDIINEKK